MVEPRGPVATDRNLAGWWTRVGAYLLDGIIAGLPGLLLIELCHQGSIGRLIGYLLTAILPVLYGAILIGLYGRTPGMRLLHVRAIHAATGRDLTRGEAWTRALAAFALYQLVGFVLLLIEWSEPTGWSAHRHPIVSAFQVLVFVLYLGLLMPLWDSRNQTLQDKAVGSIVVMW
jgi:uncharacterized RDD family membrane protein YckC